MATDTSIEQRVLQLETQLAHLERRISRGEPNEDWLSEFVGAFQKYPSFGEVVKYAREFRESQPIADDEHPV